MFLRRLLCTALFCLGTVTTAAADDRSLSADYQALLKALDPIEDENSGQVYSNSKQALPLIRHLRALTKRQTTDYLNVHPHADAQEISGAIEALAPCLSADVWRLDPRSFLINVGTSPGTDADHPCLIPTGAGVLLAVRRSGRRFDIAWVGPSSPEPPGITWLPDRADGAR